MTSPTAKGTSKTLIAVYLMFINALFMGLTSGTTMLCNSKPRKSREGKEVKNDILSPTKVGGF